MTPLSQFLGGLLNAVLNIWLNTAPTGSGKYIPC